MAALAPSSPRLPSPPPAAEIQIGPKSPSMGSMSNRQAQQMEQTALDANSKRRIHPGTKAADMAAGPPLVPLSELDSAFQLQEHLAALHYFHTGSNTSPISRDTAKLLATPPHAIDRTLWLYELCRFLIEQCNNLIVGFLFDTPPCSAATCPEMRASEWQFLCAVHEQPKSCCAIDYCCHTLDWAANVVTDPRVFPSRFVALSDAHDKGQAIKSLVNVFRRLHRIFAHAWFQHRGVFWTVEGQTGLYVFFKTVCDLYDLLPGENFKLPPEAEGLEAPPTSAHQAASGGAADLYQPQEPLHQTQPTGHQLPREQLGGHPHPVAIMHSRNGQGSGGPSSADDEHLNAVNTRTNTRRHIRSSPSTGSAVTTVMEADEDDSASDFTSRFRGMQIVDPAAAEDDLDAAEVPVIVEHGIPVRRVSGVAIGVGSTGTSQASSLPPIRIATPEKPNTTEPSQARATVTSPAEATPTGDAAEPHLDREAKEGGDSFLNSPDDVETPVQGEAQGAASKAETTPAPGPLAADKDKEPQEDEQSEAAATGKKQDSDDAVTDKSAAELLEDTSIADFADDGGTATPDSEEAPEDADLPTQTDGEEKEPEKTEGKTDEKTEEKDDK